MTPSRWMGAVVALVLAAGTAQAADPDELNLGRMTAGYSYFNRPHADVATHDADVAACLADALAVRSFQETLSRGATGILDSLIAGAQADSANRGVVSASLENCMVVRGWRVVHLDDGEGAALAALPAAQIAARLAPWIGAEAPHGIVVRSWRNDAALGAVNHFSLHAQHTKNGQLSLLSIKASVGAALKADKGGTAMPELGALDPKWPRKPLKPETLDTAPPGSAVLIVNVKGISSRQGNGFYLTREGADPRTMPSIQDHGPDFLTAGSGFMATGGEAGKFFAFAVPPGRWRIAAMWNGMLTLNFCLGAPAFDVGDGEVVFAGQLDLKQERLAPGLDLAPVRAWMAGTSAAARLRPASYVNGSPGPCNPATSIYALEFEGAPFAEGYAMGSRAPRSAP